MRIRSFRLSDYHSVTDLLEESLLEACFHETMEAFARQLSWDSELVLVAEMDEKVVGVIIGTIDHNKGYLYRTVVHANYQRQGIGRRLIEKIKLRFAQRNVNKIFVAGDIYNKTVLRLYESLGFREDDSSLAGGNLGIISGM